LSSDLKEQDFRLDEERKRQATNPFLEAQKERLENRRSSQWQIMLTLLFSIFFYVAVTIISPLISNFLKLNFQRESALKSVQRNLDEGQSSEELEKILLESQSVIRNSSNVSQVDDDDSLMYELKVPNLKDPLDQHSNNDEGHSLMFELKGPKPATRHSINHRETSTAKTEMSRSTSNILSPKVTVQTKKTSETTESNISHSTTFVPKSNPWKGLVNNAPSTSVSLGTTRNSNYSQNLSSSGISTITSPNTSLSRSSTQLIAEQNKEYAECVDKEMKLQTEKTVCFCF
jgi:hypothetical protein